MSGFVQHHVGVPPHPLAFDVGAVAVVGRGDDAGQAERVERPELVVAECLGGVQQQRGRGPWTRGARGHRWRLGATSDLPEAVPVASTTERPASTWSSACSLVGPERRHAEQRAHLGVEERPGLRRAGRASRLEVHVHEVGGVARQRAVCGRLRLGAQQRAQSIEDRAEASGGGRVGHRRRKCRVGFPLFTDGPGATHMDLGLDVDQTGDWTVLTVTGEVDVATAPSLRERLVQLIAEGNTRLVVDLSPVDFLDSTGLGVLVGTLKRIRQADGELRLIIPQERIIKLFDITGLSQIFEISDQLQSALGA